MISNTVIKRINWYGGPLSDLEVNKIQADTQREIEAYELNLNSRKHCIIIKPKLVEFRL